MNSTRGFVSLAAASLLSAAWSSGLYAQPTLPDIPTLSVDSGQIVWTAAPGATGYDLVTGDLNLLRQTGGDFTAAIRFCMADDTPSLSYPYAADPKPGEAFFFLVRPVTSSEVGTYDSGGAGQAGSRDAEIEAAPTACFSPFAPHAPISIVGNAGFTAANGVVAGSGTSADPYLIAGWDLGCTSLNSTRGLAIANATVPFVVRNVRAHDCTLDILLSATAGGRIERSMTRGGGNGIAVSSGQGVTVDGCHTLLALSSGIAVSGSNILIKRNRVESGTAGINLNNCSGCAVYQNLLLNNDSPGMEQGFGPLPNSWDSGYPGGGNFWSNYRGVDACHGPAQNDCSAPDGIGDTPVLVNATKSDRYPLMVPLIAEGDVVPPTVAVTSPADGTEVTGDPFTVSGTAADTGSGIRRVELSLNGGPWMVADGTTFWSAAVSPVDGTNALSVRALDLAGNASATSDLSVTYQAPIWQAALRTDRASYPPGAPVAITYELTNLTSHAVTLHFSTTCQAFFRVESSLDPGSPLYDLARHQGCFEVLTERTWLANETVTYNFTWTQVNDFGTQVFAEDYSLIGYMASAEDIPAGLAGITIGP
jgi:hypothetical protein